MRLFDDREREIWNVSSAVFLNGRFFRQSVTGVQRFAAETTAAIDRLIANGEWPETTMLAPPPSRGAAASCQPAAFRRLRLREVGRTRGQLWEQAELPLATRGGLLVSLGNTAPVLAGSRQVVVIHDAGVFDTPESYSLLFRTWYRTLQHGLVKAGARIVTVSEFSRDRIAARLSVDPAQIAVMYEGADHILNVPADPGTLERHGLRPGRFALVVGSWVAHKNIDALDEVAAALTRRGMVLAIAGSIHPTLVCRSAQEIGFAGRRLGRTTDAELHALYESAACLLFPSRYEGFGLPPVEAMACGCPVLAGAGGAVEEICGDGALYFAANDRRSMVNSVERLLDEPRLADDMRARGIARSAGLSWDRSARVLAGVVQTLQ
jgi:glycosyltransferase involved in cell wall biosynthesis